MTHVQPVRTVTRHTGKQRGCASVTGRLVRAFGITWIVQRNPFTTWSWFAVAPETIKPEPPK